jgi:heme exporter protein A
MRLVAENLSVARGDRPVFSGLSFSLTSGEALVVTGANGSGKSTLLKTIAGFLKPSAGTVRLENPTGGDSEAALHYLGHLNALKPALTVGENLAFWRRFFGNPKAQVEAALEEVGLAGLGDLPAGYLSAGQKRRVAIARLLVSERPLWLVDEPTAALDKPSEQMFATLLRRHLDAGGLTVAATHLPLQIESPKRLDMNGFVGSRDAGAPQ